MTFSPAVRVAFLLFAVAWGANHFVPLLLLYRDALALSPERLAQLFGVYAFGLVPGLLLGGPLSDRFGRRRLVVPAGLIALAGTALLGGGPRTFAGLLLGRFVVGLGSGVTFSAATAWVQDQAARAGTAASGIGARRAATALSAGFGGGPLVAGVLAQTLPYPLALPYAVQAAVLLVALAAVVMMPGDASRPAPPGRAAPRTDRFLRARFVPAGFVREVVPVAPWVFGFPSISFAVLPAIVRAEVGPYPALFTGVVTATTLFSGLLVQAPLRKRPAASVGRFGLAAGLVGLAIALLATRASSPLGVLLAAAALGAGYGGCLVAGLRFVETHSRSHERGRVTGLFYVLAYIGFVAPLLFASVSRRHGNTAALLGTAVLAALTLLLRLIANDFMRTPDGELHEREAKETS